MGEEIFILKMKNILITPQAFTYLSLKDLKNMFGEEYNLFLTGGQIADSSLLKLKLQNIDACLIGSETINESILKYTPKLKFLDRGKYKAGSGYFLKPTKQSFHGIKNVIDTIPRYSFLLDFVTLDQLKSEEYDLKYCLQI